MYLKVTNNLRNLFILVVLSAFVMFIIVGLFSFSHHNQTMYLPYILGWMVASINFAVALVGSVLGMKNKFHDALVIVFGGMCLRLMIIGTIVLMVTKKHHAWADAFCGVLLGSFLIYFLIEMLVLVKQGHSVSVIKR